MSEITPQQRRKPPMRHNFAKHFQFSTAALHKKYVTSASEWTCLAWTHNTGSKILNLSDYLIMYLTLMKTGVLCICRAIVHSRVDIGTAGGISRVRAEEVAKGCGWSVTTLFDRPRWASAFGKCREEICHENDSIQRDTYDLAERCEHRVVHRCARQLGSSV